MLKGQGDTGIVVSEKFFPLHDAHVYQCSDPVTESSEEENDWDDSNISMFECSWMREEFPNIFRARVTFGRRGSLRQR